MTQIHNYVHLILAIIIIKGLFWLVAFTVPLMQPPFTIQCVSTPCITPDITIIEWLQQR